MKKMMFNQNLDDIKFEQLAGSNCQVRGVLSLNNLFMLGVCKIPPNSNKKEERLENSHIVY